MFQHNDKIARVIQAMRERVDDSLSLDSMAEIAFQSPYHFIRSFHRTTGVPPRQFLAALRLQAAKRLLLTTQCSVTDACFQVGYSSLGTFITRFKHLVGTPPRHLRRLASASRDIEISHAVHSAPAPPTRAGARLSGHIEAPEGFRGSIFIGVFPSTIPQGIPMGCTLLTASGRYDVAGLRDGTYYVMAAAMPPLANPLAYLVCDAQLRGRAGPVLVRDQRATGATDIVLRAPEVTDPPILVALPVLLQQRVAAALRPSDRRTSDDDHSRHRRRHDLRRRPGGAVGVVSHGTGNRDRA